MFCMKYFAFNVHFPVSLLYFLDIFNLLKLLKKIFPNKFQIFNA